MLRSFIPFFALLTFSFSAYGQPDTLWSALYELDAWNICNGFETTEDGGFLIAGSIGPDYNDVSFWLMKADSSGNLLWSSEYADSNSISDAAYDMLLLDEDHILLAGWTLDNSASDYDIRLIMTHGDGEIIWEKFIGESVYDEYVNKVSLTSDGGYIFTGGKGITGAENLLLLKTDSLGNVQWERSFTLNMQDVGTTVFQTYDGGYLLGGRTKYAGGGYDCVVIKTDSGGEMEWQNIFDFGWPYTSITRLYEVPGGGYIGLVSELTKSTTVIFKLDESGNLVWDSRTDMGHATDMLEMPDATKICCGYTGDMDLSDVYAIGNGEGIFIMLTDTLGQPIWDAIYQKPAMVNHGGGHISTMDDGGYCIAASVQRAAGLVSIWLLRFGECTGVEEHGSALPPYILCECHPNPFSSSTTIMYELSEPADVRISIFDIAGRRVGSFNREGQEAGQHQVVWDPDGSIPAGCYTVLLESDEFRVTRRCVKATE